MTVAYLVAVIPANLGAVGMPKEAVFTATVVTSLLATALIGIIGNFPFCLAPSMGLNSFFAFSVVLGMGHSWQFALTASIISAVLLLLMTVFKIREALFDVIPSNLKKAIIVGIGLFVTFIGLRNAGIIMFGMIAVGGINTLQSVPLTRRNSLILATSLGLGLGVVFRPDIISSFPEQLQIIFRSGMSTATIIAIFLNIVLPKDPNETHENHFED